MILIKNFFIILFLNIIFINLINLNLLLSQPYLEKTIKSNNSQINQNKIISKKYTFSGFIKNGSNSKITEFPEIELISLDQGMQIIEKIKPTSLNFHFSPLTPKLSPYLIRANYKGTSYTKLIPPTPIFWNKKQELTIYESGAKLNDVKISSAMSVTKRKTNLNVEQVYVLQNFSKPMKSFDLSNIYFYIDLKAQNIRATLSYGKSSMPIPLIVKISKNIINFDKGIRPGQAEIILNYTVNEMIIKDGFWYSKDGSYTGNSKVLLWRPNDLIPEISGINFRKVEIPNLGFALQLGNFEETNKTDEVENNLETSNKSKFEIYRDSNKNDIKENIIKNDNNNKIENREKADKFEKIKNNEKTDKTQNIENNELSEKNNLKNKNQFFKYDFSKVSYLIDDPINSDENPIFNTNFKIFIGLFLIILQLFVLIFSYKKRKL